MAPITSAQTIRNRKAAAQKAQRISAEARTCPECGRKGATSNEVNTDERIVTTGCRWCPYENTMRY